MDRYQRQLFNQKASSITTGIGEPSNAEGSSGSISIRDINGQITLFAKYGSTWHGRDLGPTLIVGDTHLNHVKVGNEGVTIKDGSTILASFGETTTIKDLNLTGKIVITSTGTANVCIGAWASGNPDVGGTTNNIVIGVESGEDIANGAMKNTLLGYKAGYKITTGSNNICIGSDTGINLVEGNDNLIIGTTSLLSGDGDRAIIVGFAAQAEGGGIAIGSIIYAGVDTFKFGKFLNTTYNDFTADNTWAHSSDARLKTNVNNDTLGLNFINNLRPITYQWRQYEDVPSELLSGCTKEQYEKTDKVLHGLIAQEVKEALDIEGVDTFGGWKIDETEGGAQGISREMFVTPLIKAVQELSAKMDTMQVEIDTLKG